MTDQEILMANDGMQLGACPYCGGRTHHKSAAESSEGLACPWLVRTEEIASLRAELLSAREALRLIVEARNEWLNCDGDEDARGAVLYRFALAVCRAMSGASPSPKGTPTTCPECKGALIIGEPSREVPGRIDYRWCPCSEEDSLVGTPNGEGR